MTDAWLTTYTGKKFYPFDPNPDDISILDIAHALSNICRYGGHCSIFYSVAEHSIRVHDTVRKELRLVALLHDAAEAYGLFDIPSLVKHSDIMSQIVEAEAKLLSMIFIVFNVGIFDPVELKRAENRILAAEVRDLMPNSVGWYLPEPPLEGKIDPMRPFIAERAFLDRFYMVNKRRRAL